MIGGLSLASTAEILSTVTSINLVPNQGCMGEFLVCLSLTTPTNIAATMMVDVTRVGTGITVPEPVFRTRHVQRRIWTVQDWRASTSYNVPLNQTTITWTDSFTAPGTMPVQRWSSPFTKPKNWATASTVISGFASVGGGYLDESLSNVTADAYAPTGSVYTEADPVFFTCNIGEGQYLRFEIKYYIDDPFKVDPTTPVPTLSDAIPTTTGPSVSEIESSDAITTGRISTWMLRV